MSLWERGFICQEVLVSPVVFGLFSGGDMWKCDASLSSKDENSNLLEVGHLEMGRSRLFWARGSQSPPAVLNVNSESLTFGHDGVLGR